MKVTLCFFWDATSVNTTSNSNKGWFLITCVCVCVFVYLCICVGADADPAERPSQSGDWYHRQRGGEEVWQVLQKDGLSVFTKRSKVKVS